MDREQKDRPVIAEKSIGDVKRFWESSPLWSGESAYEPGSREFFEEHRQVIISDCFAGELDSRLFPKQDNTERVLDLGCGPGFWIVELAHHGCHTITASDLTQSAIRLAKTRCAYYGVSTTFSQQNAENMSFDDSTFTHVNCQGVIHHTPDTEACIREIARILKKGGTASISVYHRNVLLRSWPFISGIGKMLSRLGVRLKGRGRERICTLNDPDEIVRLYDGENNPIGKSYTHKQFKTMLLPYFKVEDIYFHLFPARTFPFKIPRFLHKLLDRYMGFMMYVTVRKY